MITFLANSLSQNGYEVTIYSYEGTTSVYKLVDSIKFISEENIQTNYYTRRFYQVFQVRRIIKKIKPNLVISFLTNQNVYSVLGTAFTKIPVIISERGDPFANKGIIANLKYRFYRFANGIVFQTHGAKEYFNKNIQNKSVVIPNPVTSMTREIIHSDKRKNNIVSVGRFEIKQKRQDIMIEAFNKVRSNHKDINLIFYGDGKDMGKIKELVRKYNLEHCVFFAGKVDDVQKHIYDAKMFVLTSDYEGIPNALIEAMSLGLPVISTDCSPGGAKLLIENYKNGILVPINDFNKVAEAIEFYLDNPQIAEENGKEAQMIVDKYAPQKIISIWEDYIEYIIK